MLKKPKEKKCRYCKNKFIPFNSFQSFCFKEECIKQHNKQEREKKDRKAKKEFKENDKTLLRVKIQRLANKYGRMMDYQRWLKEGCITCGIKTGKVDGGHFLPTSTYPSIRYYSKQIKCQCINCNQYNNGKPLEYEAKMRLMYGNDFVDNLLKEHRVSKNYNVEYMQKYIRVINKRVKKLELRNNLLYQIRAFN